MEAVSVMLVGRVSAVIKVSPRRLGSSDNRGTILLRMTRTFCLLPEIINPQCPKKCDPNAK